MKKQSINSAMAFTAFLQIQAELLDGCKITPLYSQKGKLLINNLLNYTEKELVKSYENGFYDNSVIELQMQGFQRAGEDIVTILKESSNGKLQDFIDMLDAFKNDRYKINGNKIREV
jgi:hypothetical protein